MGRSLLEINRDIDKCKMELEFAKTDTEHYRWLSMLNDLRQEKIEYLEGMENAR